MGLTPSEYWGSTWRELWARRKMWDRARERQDFRHAEHMATLYNAHFIREKGVPPFTPAQFMPGYKAPAKRGADWKRDKATIEAAWKQDLQTVQLATQALAGTIPAVENSQQTQQFDERAKRAREAKEAGYPAETIRAIMEGRG